jgi:alpha-D-xyloside xylohydrolase
MFGPALMVCPVYTYKATSRPVYFHIGTNWYDYETNQYFSGGQTRTVAAPCERIPLFVREGSILPVGKDIQSTKEAQTDLILKVYTGASGEFTLYEDDGVSYDYEKGAYSTIRFSYDEASKMLTVDDRKGQFQGMSEERIFNVEWIAKDRKTTVSEIKYNGKALAVIQSSRHSGAVRLKAMSEKCIE